MDVLDDIIRYENGEITDPEDVLNLFSQLIVSQTIFSLQGSYQRAADRLIRAGYLSSSGEILEIPDMYVLNP